MRFVLIIISFCFLASIVTSVKAEEVKYPFPVKYFDVAAEGQSIKMAYMDEQANAPNGKTILLLHGKNFNGYYWKDAITFLKNEGYRVLSIDQVGWGKSAKPTLRYSFSLLANNSVQLLDALKIDKVSLVGHSMGGMLAIRFALDHPAKVEKLILENPIGLEDYKQFIPYQPIEQLYQKELKGTYSSYKKYQQTYYPVWKPGYEQYVRVQAEALKFKDFNVVAYINALTYQMIYEQPVTNDMHKITVPTLLIIGQEDRTVVGKDQLNPQDMAKYGNYPALGKLANKRIPNSKLIELPGVGHIPHIQSPGLFKRHLLEFLDN